MIVTWALILFAHVGVLGDGNSNALTTVPGFTTQQACEDAGRKAKDLARNSVKEINYVCVQVK